MPQTIQSSYHGLYISGRRVLPEGVVEKAVTVCLRVIIVIDKRLIMLNNENIIMIILIDV
jgi:hypothetical protein